MNSISDLTVFFKSLSLGGSFGLNTNLLDTNLINLTIVVGLLVYFGKGVLNTLLTNRKQAILATIRDAEERYQEAIDQVNQTRARLEDAKAKAEEIRQNGLYQIEREKEELVKASNEDSQRLEDAKNATTRFEQQKTVEQIRQQVCSLALKRALETLNTRLSIDLQGQMIDYNLGLLKSM